MRKYSFTLPRRPSGLWYVQVIEQTRQPDGSWSWDMYPLKDEHGEVRTFTSPDEAWLAAKRWEGEQQQEGQD